MRPIPPEFAGLVKGLEEGLPRLLSDQLVGFYLYGSVLDDSFVSGRSDLDGIVVTESALEGPVFDRLREWLEGLAETEPAARRAQLSFLVRERAVEDDPSGCLYQFGRFEQVGFDGNPIIWLDLMQRGRVVLGSAPQSFLPPISRDVLREALVREVNYLREGLAPGSEWREDEAYRAYAVLTLCRILYTNATGELATKKAAAEWAEQHVPEEWHRLIQVALGVSEQSWIATTPPGPILRFVEWVDEWISEA